MNSTTNSSFNQEETNWIYIAVHVTSAITFLIGFPTNIMIINLVLRRRSLKNPTNYFVSSLAVADVLVLVWMLLWIIGIHAFPMTKVLHKYVYPSLDIFLGIASMLNVACVSMDRAIAVTCPLSYENIMTRKKSYLIIVACWIFSLVVLIGALLRITFEEFAYNKVILYIGFACYFIPVLIIITCYALIMLAVIQQLKGIEKILATVRHVLKTQDQSEKRRRRRRKVLRELKITGNVLLIVIPFTAGWTFFIATHIYEEIEGKQIISMGHNFAMIIIPWILSGLNPILYLILTRSLRRAFTDVVQKIFKGNKYPFDESRSSIFASFSRRASNVFRRASTSVDDGNGFLTIPKFSNRRRESKSSHSVRSFDGGRDTELNLLPASYEERELIQYATVV